MESWLICFLATQFSTSHCIRWRSLGGHGNNKTEAANILLHLHLQKQRDPADSRWRKRRKETWLQQPRPLALDSFCRSFQLVFKQPQASHHPPLKQSGSTAGAFPGSLYIDFLLLLVIGSILSLFF